jgi:hypothetical protein
VRALVERPILNSDEVLEQALRHFAAGEFRAWRSYLLVKHRRFSPVVTVGFPSVLCLMAGRAASSGFGGTIAH